MVKLVKQARAAFSLLNPDEVETLARKPVTFGLVAGSDRGYEELEDFLVPPSLANGRRLETLRQVHRAGDPDAPRKVDLVLFEHGVEANPGAYTFDRRDPQAVIVQMVADHADMALRLARQYPEFRKPVVDTVVRNIARENALFAIATALPDVVPSLLELPWAFGEFASDTAFLTANQLRMAFQVAAAHGRPVGLAQQKAEVVSIVAGAFGWRALARELVGKIPMGGGLIPKGAIAYAGTWMVGKGLEYLYRTNGKYPRAMRREAYREALQRGREVAGALIGKVRQQNTVN